MQNDENETQQNEKPQRGVRVLYVSPLKALAVDIDRNLKTPIAGLQEFASQHGIEHHVPRVAVRSGDTPQKDRAAIKKTPPEILITTPESLYLMLTSKADAVLSQVETVIIDEIHAIAGTNEDRICSQHLNVWNDFAVEWRLGVWRRTRFEFPSSSNNCIATADRAFRNTAAA